MRRIRVGISIVVGVVVVWLHFFLFGLVQFSVSVSISISVSVSFLGTRISGGCVCGHFIYFSLLFSLFSCAFEGFVYLFLLTFFSLSVCQLPFSVFSVAFFMQSTVNFVVFFFCFFWRFNSGNFLNAPLCVCRRKGEGRGFGAC